MDRSAGILMPISSLPSPYGIGTFGKAAYRFADFLHEAGQKYWQLLPLGPTSYGDSPYQAFSTFAGNPYFIDLDTLIADDLLTQTEVDACAWGTEPRYVDYGKIYESRFALLEKAKAGDLQQTVSLAEAVEAPVALGSQLGTLTVTSGEEVVAELPILAGEEIPRVTFSQMLVQMLRTAFLCG